SVHPTDEAEEYAPAPEGREADHPSGAGVLRLAGGSESQRAARQGGLFILGENNLFTCFRRLTQLGKVSHPIVPEKQPIMSESQETGKLARGPSHMPSRNLFLVWTLIISITLTPTLIAQQTPSPAGSTPPTLPPGASAPAPDPSASTQAPDPN